MPCLTTTLSSRVLCHPSETLLRINLFFGHVHFLALSPIPPAQGIRGFPSLLYFRNGKFQKHKGPRTLDGLKEFVFNKGDSDIEWTDVPGEPGMFSQFLVSLEKFVTGDTISSNVMVNALVVGLGLGAICLVVTLGVLTMVFPTSADEEEAAPVAKKTDGDDDNEPSVAKPKAATGDSPVRRRVKATTD